MTGKYNIKDLAKIFVLEVMIYVLFLMIIMIENYFILALLGFGIYTGLMLIKRRKPQIINDFKNIYAKNHMFSNITIFLLVFTFPMIMKGNPYWIQVANMVGLYIMMALGLNIMVGNAGLTCLGYAAFYAIGGYTYAILATNFGLSFWLSILISAVIVMVFGFILGLPALRVKGHYLALITIAFGLVIYQLTLNLESITGGANGIMNIPEPFIGTHSFNNPINFGFIKLPFQANYFYFILVLIGLTILVVGNLSNSLTGLKWNAMREDELAAQCYGINLTKNKLWAFAFGAIFGGIAGAVYAGMIGFIAPENFTYTHSVLILSMVLLGGIDSIPGVILGAFLLTIIPEKFRAFADYRMMFYGIIVVLILLFKNDGLIPSTKRIFTSKQMER